MADNIDKLMNEFPTQDFDQFLKSTETNTNDTAIINALNKVIQYSGVDLGQVISPYINGYYLIFMQTGDWGFNIAVIEEDQLSVTNFDGFFKARVIQSADKKFENAQLNNSIKSFGNLTFPLLATDIDLPEPSKEYTNVSSRSQSITAYHKEILLPDFTISYIENQNLDVIRYHELWHKTIELYRRGLAITYDEIKRDTDILKSYFYSVPYVNNIWVLTLDVQFNIKALISLIGVKPVSMPLKSFLGNRSAPKMTVYNISYKASTMFYQFYKDTEDFIKKASDPNNILSFEFKNFLTDANDNSNNLDYQLLLSTIKNNFPNLNDDDLKKIADNNSSPQYQSLIKKAIKNNTNYMVTETETNDYETEENAPISYNQVIPDKAAQEKIDQYVKQNPILEDFAKNPSPFPQIPDDVNTKADIAEFSVSDKAPNPDLYINNDGTYDTKKYYEDLANAYIEEKYGNLFYDSYGNELSEEEKEKIYEKFPVIEEIKTRLINSVKVK